MGWPAGLTTALCYFPRNWWSFISRILSKIVSSRWIPPCSSLTRSLRGEPSANHQVGGRPQAGGLHSTFSGFQGLPAPTFGFSNFFQMLIYVTLCDVGGFSFHLLKIRLYTCHVCCRAGVGFTRVCGKKSEFSLL